MFSLVVENQLTCLHISAYSNFLKALFWCFLKSKVVFKYSLEIFFFRSLMSSTEFGKTCKNMFIFTFFNCTKKSFSFWGIFYHSNNFFWYIHQSIDPSDPVLMLEFVTLRLNAWQWQWVAIAFGCFLEFW